VISALSRKDDPRATALAVPAGYDAAQMVIHAAQVSLPNAFAAIFPGADTDTLRAKWRIAKLDLAAVGSDLTQPLIAAAGRQNDRVRLLDRVANGGKRMPDRCLTEDMPERSVSEEVKSEAHHFPSNRPIPRYAATATKQIDRRVPPTTARSAGTCNSIAPSRGHGIGY